MDDLVLLVTRIQKADRPRPAAPAPPPSPGGRFPLTGTARDVRYAIRTLWRAPRFAAAAIGTLAVALGAGATVFAVVSGVLLSRSRTPNPTASYESCAPRPATCRVVSWPSTATSRGRSKRSPP